MAGRRTGPDGVLTVSDGQPAVLETGRAPPGATTKVSSDLPPRTVGFQAKAAPACTANAASGVPGTTSNSRDR